MTRIFVRLMLYASVLFVSACASHPEIPFDRTAAAGVKKIGVVAPAFPTGSSVILASTVGQNFGLIGALIDQSMKTSRETDVNQLLSAQKFDAKAEFSQALEAALQRQGYETFAVAPVRKQGSDFVDATALAGQPPADAYLDIVVDTYGFMASGISSSNPYRPIVYLKCRLVSANDPARVLMYDTILVNPLGSPKDAVQVFPSATDAFVDFDNLVANPTRTTEALVKAIDQSADTVGKVLN